MIRMECGLKPRVHTSGGCTLIYSWEWRRKNLSPYDYEILPLCKTITRYCIITTPLNRSARGIMYCCRYRENEDLLYCRGGAEDVKLTEAKSDSSCWEDFAQCSKSYHSTTVAWGGLMLVWLNPKLWQPSERTGSEYLMNKAQLFEGR